MELFKPDNFSQATIHFKDYIDGNVNSFAEILKEYFNDFKIEKIYQVDRAEIQTQNYKIILTESGRSRTILFKKYKVSPDLDQTEFYLNLLDVLLAKGVLVSRVLKTLGGKLIISVAGELYSVFDFIDGDHFVPTEQAWADVAINLAKMHLAFNEFDENYFQQIDTFSQKGYYPFNVIKNYTVEDFSLIEDKINSKTKIEEAEKILLEKLPVFKAAVEEVKKNEEQIARLPKQIIHSDFHPHNIIMSGNQVKVIIDFENARVSQQAREISFAIYKFGRQFFVTQRAQDDISGEAQRLKDLFIEKYSQIKPLSKKEIALLPILAKDTFIRKLLFVLKGVYHEGNNIWINDLPKHMVAIDEINYFWP